MGTKSEDEINKILQSDPRDVLETPDPHPTNTLSLQEHGISNPYFRAHDRGTETDMVVMAEGAAHKASARPKRDFCAAFGPGGAIAARVSRVKPFPRRVAGMLSEPTKQTDTKRDQGKSHVCEWYACVDLIGQSIRRCLQRTRLTSS